MIKWIVMVLVIASLFVGCDYVMDKQYPHIAEGEPYRLETTWGPVIQSFGPCWSTGSYRYRYRATCWMHRKGMPPERVSLETLPGHIVQVGERLGITYKIGDKVVESYTVRDKWNHTWFPRTSCWKDDPECYWPSKQN